MAGVAQEVRLLVVILWLVLSCVGCRGAERMLRGAEGAANTRSSSDMPRRSTIYFLTDQGRGLVGVRRMIVPIPPGPASYARGAISVLLRGPSVAEVDAGLGTALPTDTRLRKLDLVGQGGAEAVVDFAQLPSAGVSGVERARIIAQVARTLIDLGGIERVRLRADGQPWGLWRQNGGILDRAYDLEALHGFNEICTAVPGTEALEGDCFTTSP
jgi:spore germination protein GerM